MVFKHSLYIFHRDLNIHHNPGLRQCLHESENVTLIFIVTPTQASSVNLYRSEEVVTFMCAVLYRMMKTVPISLHYGEQTKVLEKIVDKYDAVWEHKDASPYARHREEATAKLCAKHEVDYVLTEGIMLRPFGSVTKDNGDYYKLFTPFYNKLTSLGVDKPQPIRTLNNIFTVPSGCSLKKVCQYIQIPYMNVVNYDLKTSIPQTVHDYIPGASTSGGLHISQYVNFGVYPIQYLYHKSSPELQRQLVWREFYLYVIRYDLHYSSDNKWIPAMKNNKKFRAWASGQTGVPIVDAGMRELNQTGYLHNRMRLIVAMFLIHYLKIDWHLGERHFATHLRDYDYSNNKGNWLWCVAKESFACKPKDIFSIENQSKKVDQHAEYIKQWVPEVTECKPTHIHEWGAKHRLYNTNYIPIITKLTRH
jgi:deoxyribodipyrimidine photo-lyase